MSTLLSSAPAQTATIQSNTSGDISMPDAPAPASAATAPTATAPTATAAKSSINNNINNNNIPSPNLPPHISALFPQTPLNTEAEATFQHRKAEILRKFTLEQIQALLAEEVAKVDDLLAADRRNNEDIQTRIKILVNQRALERKLWERMKKKKGDDEGGGAVTATGGGGEGGASNDGGATTAASGDAGGNAAGAEKMEFKSEAGVEKRDFANTDYPGSVASKGEEEGEIGEDGEDVKMSGD